MAAPSHLIVIGTSAGGIPALVKLVTQLPATLPAAVLVVQHFVPDSDGQELVDLLASHTSLICRLPVNGDLIQPGTLYLAPPDRHLLAKDGSSAHLLVNKGPHENHYRPAADALFRSAAVAFGPGVIGIVLTGLLFDGTAGLEFIKRCGGVTIVQDPLEAEHPSMPASALRHVDIDFVVPLAIMGSLLDEIMRGVVPERKGEIPEDIRLESIITERVLGSTEAVAQIGHQVPLSCPDCGGSLWQVNEGKILRYRCHTGHAFTADTLLHDSQLNMEESLWIALRLMEERRNLLTGMANRQEAQYPVKQSQRLDQISTQINRLREFLLTDTDGSQDATVASPES